MDAVKGVLAGLAGLLYVLLFPVVMVGAAAFLAIRGLLDLAREVARRAGRAHHLGPGEPARCDR